MAVQLMSPPAVMHVALITGEELFKMGDLGRTELVKGEIVYMSPTGYTHGSIEVGMAVALSAFVRRHRLGQVFSGEVGIYTGRNPDTVRAADAAFVSRQRMAQVKSRSYLDVAPELVVEVLSPDDRWNDLMDKLDEYFAIGVQLIWVAAPRRQQVYVYRSVTDVQRLSAGDTLTGGEVLPGFNAPVAELFEIE